MNNPKLLQLYQKRKRVAKKIKENYSTIKAAEGMVECRRESTCWPKSRVDGYPMNVLVSLMEMPIEEKSWNSVRRC